ncbi:peptide-methionine (S)-S-oxide reductase [Campylobacter jejuni]
MKCNQKVSFYFSMVTFYFSADKTYYKAENYHQHYFINNPNQGYCQAVIAPKLQKIQSD